MKRKIFVYVLTLCLIVAFSFALTACSNEHNISIKQNDYLNISANVYTAKSEEKVTISYTKRENFVEKPGYEVKLMVQTNDQKAIVVNYDESGNYYFIMPDCDVSISAEYLPIQYTITYDLKGGENNANNPTTYTVDSNDIIISQPVRSGFYFWGWTINDDSQIVRNYTIPSGTTGNITLKANWKQTLDYSFYSTTYTGEELSVNASNFVGSNKAQFVEISGNTKATNAGTYNVTLSLKDKVNYCWRDGTTEDKTATWEIVKAKFTVTRPSYKRYSGEEISVTSEDFTGSRLAELVDLTGTTSATNAGTYNVTLSLKDKANTTWEDGTTEDKTTTWEIGKRSIEIKKEYRRKTTYSGDEIFAYDLVLYSSDVDFVDITGTVSATNAGVYEVTLSLKDKENTIWSDKTTEDKTITWEIKSYEITLKKPYYAYTPYYYSTEYSLSDYSHGNEQSIKPNYFVDSENIKFIDITGTTSATNAGIYNVTLTLKDKANYCWGDGTTEDKTAQWRITPITVSLNLPVTKEYTGRSIRVGSLDFADYKNSDFFYCYSYDSSLIGTHYATLSLEDKVNYRWDDGTTDDITVPWSIVPANVYIDLSVIKNYTGDEITVTPADFTIGKYRDLFTISGTTSATNAGTYNVTLSLKDKEKATWEDGTTEDKTAQWCIAPAKISFHTRVAKEYTGDIITITPDDFAALKNRDLFTISGGITSATNVGTYNVVTLSLIDKEKTTWEDGTTEDKTAQWCIVPAKVSFNTSVAKEYTGDVITITPADFSQKYDNLFTISGTTSATDAGTYNVTLSLKDKVNYCWEDGTTEDKTATWEIGKKSIHYLLDYKFGKYSGKELSVTSEYFTGSSLAELVDVTGTTNATYPGVYNVTLSLKDKVNYCWEDGTTEDKNATWEIQKRIIYLQSYKWETYSGEELSAYNVIVADSHAVDFVNITGTASATNVGVYEITLSLKDKENTIWSDGTTEDKNATWEIKKRKIATLDQFETIYTGDEVVLKNTYFIANINDSKFITLLGRTKATEVGTYDVILSLIDKANTTWEDGTTEDKTISWEIKTPSKVTLKNEKTEKVFTGSEISVTSKDFVNLSPIAVEITGTTSATNVGTYNVTLSLKDKANTTWEDGTTDDKIVTWEIVKAKLTVTRYTPLYSGEEKVVTSVNLISEDEYADFVTVSGQTSATEPGAYTVTLSLNDKINMTWSDGTTDDKTVKWKIQRLDWKNNVAVSAFVKKIYTGEEITVTSADFILAEEYADYITISGQTSGTEKGTYTVTISLADKENMTWDDDTTEDKTVQWIIAD